MHSILVINYERPACSELCQDNVRAATEQTLRRSLRGRKVVNG